MTTSDDRRRGALAFDAARLVAFGLRPKLTPGRDGEYAALVRRYRDEPAFADVTAAVAGGLGIVILEVSDRAGLVAAGAEESAFAVRIGDYARRAGGEHRSADRLLHALAHLAVAALAFPRPADLADDAYVGRVSVDGVDAFVREACRLLEERAGESGGDPDIDIDTGPQAGSGPGSGAGSGPGAEPDPDAGGPRLERAWRVYSRRAATGATRDARRPPGSTTGIVARAMTFLADSGCLVPVGETGGATFRTTARYQVQVRELAADAAMDELLALGVVTVVDGSGSVRVVAAHPDLTTAGLGATADLSPTGTGVAADV